MKVFRMNDKDWVVAKTERGAKTYYRNLTGISREEINDTFQGEVDMQDTMYSPLDLLSAEEKTNMQRMKNVDGTMWFEHTFEWLFNRQKIKETSLLATTEVPK